MCIQGPILKLGQTEIEKMYICLCFSHEEKYIKEHMLLKKICKQQKLIFFG